MFKRLSLILIILCVLVSYAYAQEVAPTEPAWKMLLNMFLISVLPPLWAAVSPMATAGITAGVNKLAGAYVPRTLQVVMSGAIAAVLAGLAGDPSGVTTAAAAGVVGQGLAMTKPETLKTSGPPES